MKEIKIRQDFGIYELGSEAEITPVIKKIDIEIVDIKRIMFMKTIIRKQGRVMM